MPKVPATLDEVLSPEWLTAALAQRFPGIEVTTVTAGPVVSRLSTNARFTIEVVSRPKGSRGFVMLPKRWVVERSFAWLEKCRRLLKNCERKLNSSLQFVHLVFLVLLLRRS